MTNTLVYVTFISILICTCMTLTVVPVALYLQGFNEGMVLGITTSILFIEANTCFWLACQ